MAARPGSPLPTATANAPAEARKLRRDIPDIMLPVGTEISELFEPATDIDRCSEKGIFGTSR
jgi:hypothetical protein